MRLGLNTGYVGSDGDVGAALALALEAERLGYDSLWVPEPYGNDAATVLAWIAGHTERILLGTGILAMPGRTPAMCAQTAATLDLISGGRLLLGLGSSGPAVSEGWHGVAFARQLARTREYVDVVRMALRRERLEYHGETIDLPLDGRPLRLLLRPLRAEVPVYLAALGPRNVALCGELAEGWLPFLWAPEHAAALRTPLDEGARAAGRTPHAVAVCPTVFLSVDDDVEQARDAVRPTLALYVGGMGPRTRNFYNRLIASYGFDSVAREVQELYLAGRTIEAASALPDDLVDMVTLCGPVDRVADRLSAYREAGATTVIAFPVGTAERRLEQVREFARAADRSGQVEA